MPRVSLVALAGLIMVGCSLSRTAPEPPVAPRTIDPSVEWSELKANAAMPRAALTVDVHVTLPEYIVYVVPTATVRILPYAAGFREELAALLRWKYGLNFPPQRTDASRYIDAAIARYEQALAVAGLGDLSRSLVAALRSPLEADLVPGDYIALSEYRTIGRGSMHKIWVWLERVRLPAEGTRLTLGDDNRFCFETFAGAGCRSK